MLNHLLARQLVVRVRLYNGDRSRGVKALDVPSLAGQDSRSEGYTAFGCWYGVWACGRVQLIPIAMNVRWGWIGRRLG
jgi:hypothetical protein